MPHCLVSFGANVGDAFTTIHRASAALRDALGERGQSYMLSPCYKTPPVGGPAGQPPFVNAVAAFECEHDPWELWNVVRQLETQFGRQRIQRWEARKLDLDILLFGCQRIWTPQLKIPHPRMCMRRFIVIPASDVAADWVDPVSGLTIGQFATRLRERPASICVCSDSETTSTSLLAAAARQAGAEWIADDKEPGRSRWVSLIPHTHWSKHPLARAASLLVLLADNPNGTDATWEDMHRNQAIELNLATSNDGSNRVDFRGPKYLLPCDDANWAIHELVSAMDAMDCPVERL